MEPLTNILIAEDSKPNQTLLCYRLRSQGYQVTASNNGAEALDELRKASFDLVFLDITMPEMDGLETLRRIRDDEATRSLPVIILTASALEDHLTAAENLGVSCFLQKPINARTFSNFVFQVHGTLLLVIVRRGAVVWIGLVRNFGC